MKTHRLKTVGTAWDAINTGEKTFEVRRNDRFFQKGDVVELVRLDDRGFYDTGLDRQEKVIRMRIGWMLQGGQFGIEPGYCVFSLEPLP